MLSDERQIQIAQLVENKGSVTVHELMEIFKVSESTIRRDLTELDANGKLVKVHGGAIALHSVYCTTDDDFKERKNWNKEGKIAIAKYAASLIQPNDFVFIDAGTSTEFMIDFITSKNVIFVTNAVSHARKLTQKGFKTYVLGGEFKQITEAIVGEETILSVSKYNFTKGFFGTNGISKRNGFTTPDLKEAQVKQEAIRRCKECYVLADSSKFNKISSITFAAFSQATIITNVVKDKEFLYCKNILEVNKQ
ncbi:DeoR/GlpR family DNA-binding transcription regulator [Garciella nitratireducens]|uniref:Transcriptional regulator, DeoR family n=1 Tax=Garciella nitratireducens DSM 15102 TaxID=1121911 RepID=A0A1T4M4H5_9FIRM|nr:DeoR/GlpR family DNA-binding transcription regulator [Garciella nitratireducens]RBP44034.1 DeoR family transcriptional regulator [Garciella nitratireducens]SJZ61909.1 transcriptional regulator, DeoR family [Garciella nitratireducens DSM 15102]